MMATMKDTKISKLSKFLKLFAHKMVILSCAQNDCIHAMWKFEDMFKGQKLIRFLNVVKRHFPLRIQTLHVFKGLNGPETYVAFSAQDARAVQINESGCYDDDADSFEKVRDLSLFPIWDTDATTRKEVTDIPLFGKVSLENDHYKITAPAWCWALSMGRGLLCSEEY